MLLIVSTSPTNAIHPDIPKNPQMMNKLAYEGSEYTNPERDAIIPKIPITKNNNATFIIEKFMVKKNDY